jgi:diketogulonate reductase-like aldo/keto reductase
MEQRISINSVNIPTFLDGTAWKEDGTKECVREALNAGLRGIDTANQRKHYHEAGTDREIENIP